jgi:hypothetical protein
VTSNPASSTAISRVKKEAMTFAESNESPILTFKKIRKKF